MAEMIKEDPKEIFNHDIVMLNDKFNRYIKETMYSQSSGLSGMQVHDMVRMRSYVNAINGLADWIMAQPLLDLPETHPRPYPLEAQPEVVTVESEVCNMCVRMLEACRTEMIHSQSARLPSTLIGHDNIRLRLLTAKMAAFLDDYVEPLTPLDLPESSPDEQMSGHGRGGV